jgi:hypothetical protein
MRKVMAIPATLVMILAMAAPTFAQPTGGDVCDHRTGVVHNDAESKKSESAATTWNEDEVCPTASGAPVYVQIFDIDGDGIIEEDSEQTGTMTSTESWVVCYDLAEVKHQGGNNVWYYTQADVEDPDWPGNEGWGFMPAYYVLTEHDPDPGVPPCPWMDEDAPILDDDDSFFDLEIAL